MTHWLEIYSDKSIDLWRDRIINARFGLGLNYEESKKLLTKKHGITGDEYEGICELMDEIDMNIKLEE
mgnify:CR=1 FL=1|jgi:hypothetical protein|tara:strand:+ start:1766 stop:1969 length:204 start_codon:yes stop_codon:yes gene_type:complete